jgi:hypothetical protein
MKRFPLTAASLFSVQQKMAYPVFSENIGNALFGFASADRLRHQRAAGAARSNRVCTDGMNEKMRAA